MNKQTPHKVSGVIGFENARALRKTSTEAEDILWEILRGRRFMNLKFRRQHPLYNYIVDFYCHELTLAIEVDGDYHLLNEQKAYDEQRTQELEARGIQVIRFTNDEIVNIDFTLGKLKSFIECLKVPSPKGEG